MATRPPARPVRPARARTARPAKPARRRSSGGPRRLSRDPRRRLWWRRAALAAGVVGVVGLLVLIRYWVSYGRIIEARLGGEQRPVPRIFARPIEVEPGQGISPAELVQRLNDLGYAERTTLDQPGEFTVAANAVTLRTRPDGETSQTVQVEFSHGATPVVTRLTIVAPAAAPAGGRSGRAARPVSLDRLELESPMLAALAPGEKRRYVPLAKIPPVVAHAVIAIEDRRFYEHPGVDPIRSIGAIVTNLRGDKPYLVGGSTLTQQIVKNTFLTPEKTMKRKLQEQFMALVLESRFTKDQILELYLNDVVLGQRGPFEIHGVAEAARIFFGKDLSNVTLAEAATIAGVIQSPSRLSPFRNPDRARDRRNVVLHEMVDAGYASADDAAKAARAPLGVSTRALENEAPYFVDYVSQLVDEKYSNLLKKDAAVDVYTTLDLRLQRMAQDAVDDGIAQVDKQLAARKRKGTAEVALVAVDPRTGEILAFVGGRSYSQSQFDRVLAAKRQTGSVFKPFVYLAAFERMAEEHRSDLTPATRRRRRADDVQGRRERLHAGELSERVRRAHRPCATRWRSRATSSPSRSPSRSATTGSPTSGRRSAWARPPNRIRRSRSACSRRRRSTWPPPTRCSPTAASNGRSRPLRASSRTASPRRSRRPSRSRSRGRTRHSS